MPVKKLTPVLSVEQIEPVLPFWTQHFGFIKTVEVPRATVSASHPAEGKR
jgi:hypothetical protein